MTSLSRARKMRLAAGFLVVILLLAGVFTLGSLNLPFEPSGPAQLLVLWALSTFLSIALLIFGLVLTRSLLRLWAERRAGLLGMRFKTKMVLGAMGISLLPGIFLFFVSYSLLNRTLGKWFPRPLEDATAESRKLLEERGRFEHARLERLANQALQHSSTEEKASAIEAALTLGADAAWTLDSKGDLVEGRAIDWREEPGSPASSRPDKTGIHLRQLYIMPSGLEVWEGDGRSYLAAGAKMEKAGTLLVGLRMPRDFARRYAEIEKQRQAYTGQKQQLRAFKSQMLVTLLLVTLLLLFSVTWTALYLAKQVTVPIEALAAATREISQGNLEHRVNVQAQDELGTLVRSFNEMTAQLGESRAQIQEFNRSLQRAVNEIEQRRLLMETILENIPTGVISLGPDGTVNRINPAVIRIFGDPARESKTLSGLAGPEATRVIERLMRRALRMSTASKELEIELPRRTLHAAVTVSSLGPRRANPGFVVVIDDLSELLHAQKSAAWQEVAQRIAHEIKNPLTPIQLSAQRLKRFLERQGQAPPGARPAQAGDLASLVGECAGLIEREVATLEALVDEFSQFARFPGVKPVTTDLNAVMLSALEVFSGRLDGVAVRTDLAAGLPPIKADPELLRRVVVNLIDNAAEAMESSAIRELELATRLGANGETVEITVADTGHGIAPGDKDKLFLPRFSTRERGTGLGLAIADRIIAEHHGTIRIEDNQPQGSRFVIRLPLAELLAVRASAAGQG